jgi:hypothetical protein
VTFGAHTGPGDALAQLDASERPIVGQRPLDHRDPALRRARIDPLLSQPPGAGGEELRRRQRLQPRIVLAGDQVQRAAAQPSNDERAIRGQAPVDVSGGQANGPGSDREPGALRVLRLHGEQVHDDFHRRALNRDCQQLRAQALADHAPGSSLRRPRPSSR